MKKLNRFNKDNKKRNIILIGAFLLVGLILVGISYAVYQKEDEIKFINAKVGNFETSSSDIELALTLDGEDISTPPNKTDGFYDITVECDYADGKWNMEEWGANIRNIKSNRVKCNVNFETLETRPLSIVELGDYISMTPTSTSYTISTNLTGYSSNQTINPSELNLWRVIKKNEDGTVEVVSEYVSSAHVSFYGKVGYMNYVGTLNTIALQYTNEKYVSKTRHMGYSNQIQNCSSFSVCLQDTGYQTDINLVNIALGSLQVSNDDKVTPYWLASRTVYSVHNLRALRYYSDTLFYHFVANESGATEGTSALFSVRPILTLKSDIEVINGDGKSAETTYQLEY